MAVVAATTYLVSSCSLLSDFDGFTGPPLADATPVTDSSGDSGDVIPGPNDAATEAGSDGSPIDSGAPRGCALIAADAHAACVDFDTASDLAPTGFVSMLDGDGGMLAVEPGVAFSSPNALHGVLPRRGATSPPVNARAERRFSRSWGKIHVEFMMYLSAPAFVAGDKNSSVADLRFSSSTTGFQVYLVVGAGSFGLTGSPAVGGYPTGDQFPFDVWTRVVVDFGPTSFTVSYDGKTLVSNHTLPQPGSGQAIFVDIGPNTLNEPMPKLDVRYDDVTVDFPP